MIIQDKNLKDLFFSSAKEYVKTITAALLKLEKNPGEGSFLEEAFRNTHSLKSESLTMGFEGVGTVCHEMEELFQESRDQGRALSVETIDIFLRSVDAISEALACEEKGEKSPDMSEVIAAVKHLKEKTVCVTSSVKKEDQGDTSSMEEKAPLQDIKQIVPSIDTIQVDVKILDKLMNLVEELLIAKMQLAEITEKEDIESLPAVYKRLDFLISEIQYYVSKARLLPVGQIFEPFPRIVRDLAKNLNKKIDFIMEGDLKLDRFIATRISEPLVHLIKNSVDHGIETPKARTQAGKKETGTIRLLAKKEKEQAVVELSDDGKGFDFKSLREKLKKGNKEDSKNFSDNEMLDILFRGGISTAREITNLSGRGVGLNIVKSVMDQLGGKVEVRTTLGEGTTFILRFPLTVAILKALLVRLGNEKFAIPISNVIKPTRVAKKDITIVADIETMIVEKDKEVQLLDLKKYFHIPSRSAQGSEDEYKTVILVGEGKECVGFIVDKILSLEEIIVKPLSKNIAETASFSGATILGDGKTVLILDPAGILRTIERDGSTQLS